MRWARWRAQVAFMTASFFGGPLFVGNLLRPRIGLWPTLLITLVPVGIMLLGSMNDGIRSSRPPVIVRAGLVGLSMALGMHLYALWCIARGATVDDASFHYIGIVVGVAWSAAYLFASRPWKWRTGESPSVGHPSSPQPIEPT